MISLVSCPDSVTDSPSHQPRPPQLRLSVIMVFLRSSVEGISATFFGKTIKKPETPFPRQSADNTMPRDTLHDEKAMQASDDTSEEQTSSDVTMLTGTVVEAQPHRTGKPMFWPDKFKPLRAARSDRERARQRKGRNNTIRTSTHRKRCVLATYAD